VGQSVKIHNSCLALALPSPIVPVSRRELAPFLSEIHPMWDLHFKLETSYGRHRAYPVDQTAILLVRLAKSKTLLPQDIGTFSGLGYRCIDQDGNEITPSVLY
jgi:hypothetical protein